MDILMPEADSPGAHVAAARLRGAGHQVFTCGSADDSNPCALSAGGKCPLDMHNVDACVVVRVAGQDRQPTADGALCAARRRVPVVVGGCVAGHPYGALAAATCEGSDPVATVEETLNAPLPHHSAVATAALRRSLGSTSDSIDDVRADVIRKDGALAVRLLLGNRDADPDTAVKVGTEVRALDPWARTIDVAVVRNQ